VCIEPLTLPANFCFMSKERIPYYSRKFKEVLTLHTC
jgi:hypothetical protein